MGVAIQCNAFRFRLPGKAKTLIVTPKISVMPRFLSRILFFTALQLCLGNLAMAASVIQLPLPVIDGNLSLEQTLTHRRSVRAFASKALDVAQISQLLWAAQGITGQGSYRTAPSAGALYPLELYLVAGLVDGLQPGVYHYRPSENTLIHSAVGDRRAALREAALGQSALTNAPAVVVICGVFERTTVKYGHRGDRYVHMEAGHAAQNLALQAVALGLASVPIGAFGDAKVQQALALPPNAQPLYLLPVGWP